MNPFETLENKLDKIESLLVKFFDQPLTEPQSENCNVQEAAELLKVSTQSIHSYIKKGKLPAQQIGRKYLIKRADLENALQETKSLKYRRN
tara:strand:+ start:183 stop:455 length:273 start_codon:yes stop_codon:yes gene_type:complete